MLSKLDLTGADIKDFMLNVRLPFADQAGAMKYHDVHSGRYAITLKALRKVPQLAERRALELAANPYGMTALLASELGENLTLATFADPPNQREVSIGVGGRDFRLSEYGFNVERDVWALPEESFDLVIACEIVEHLAMDPMALFAGANRVLQPGGYFFVSTPNAACIQNFLKLGRLLPPGIAQQFRRPMGLSRIYERHNREYTPFTIGEMMKAAGFEIVIMETDSAFAVNDLGYRQEDIDALIQLIGIPELRCDTINVIGRKIGPVVDRYPEAHELYVASDSND